MVQKDKVKPMSMTYLLDVWVLNCPVKKWQPRKTALVQGGWTTTACVLLFDENINHCMCYRSEHDSIAKTTDALVRDTTILGFKKPNQNYLRCCDALFQSIILELRILSTIFSFLNRQKLFFLKTHTLLLYLPDLLHSFLQDCTFVRFDIEIVDVVEVGEYQLCKFFDVFVLVLAVAFLVAPLGTADAKKQTKPNGVKKINKYKHCCV